MLVTEAQIAFFHDEGYLVLEDVLDEADLRPVIDEYAAIIDERAKRLHSEGKVTALHEAEPFNRRLMCLAAEAPEIAAGFDIMQARGQATFNFLKHPKILDIAESLVGSEIICNPIQHIRAVMPYQPDSGRRPTPWHQDAGVCWPDADPHFMLTVWIPIVDATLGNGCLQVIPRSHKHGLFPHAFSPAGLAVPPEHLPDTEPKPLPVKAGDVILFHNYTAHAARPNESDTVRWSFDLRYHDAYQPTGRPFYPAFLVRSKARPKALQDDYAVWCQRWEFALEHSKGAQAYRWPRT